MERITTEEPRAQSDGEQTPSEMPAIDELEINGMKPFWSHADGVYLRLSEAYALLSLLESAHQICEVTDEATNEPFDNTRHEIQGRALGGIGTLIALAQYHNECAHAERRQRAGGAS